MGVSHLFVVSGFHIALFFILVERLASGVIKSRKLTSTLAFTISTGFLYLVYMPWTGLRAIVTLGVIRSDKFDKVDSLSITGLIFFVLNPWIMFTSSMILSFAITFAIYLYRPKQMSAFDTITLSLFAFFIAVPSVSTWDQQHNLLAPIISVCLTPLVSVMYTVSLVLLPFQKCWQVVNPIFRFFFIYIYVFSSLSLQITLPLINFNQQIILTILSVIFIGMMRKREVTIFSTFFSIATILFII